MIYPRIMLKTYSTSIVYVAGPFDPYYVNPLKSIKKQVWEYLFEIKFRFMLNHGYWLENNVVRIWS